LLLAALFGLVAPLLLAIEEPAPTQHDG